MKAVFERDELFIFGEEGAVKFLEIEEPVAKFVVPLAHVLGELDFVFLAVGGELVLVLVSLTH